MNPMMAAGPTMFSQPAIGMSADRTDRTFEEFNAVAGAGLNIGFFYGRIRIDDQSSPQTHGSYKTVLYVAKQPKGDRLTMKVKMITESDAARLYPHEFAMFKDTGQVLTHGTPLYELPGISASQIGLLTIYGITSIEDLMSVAEEQISQMGMDARAAREVAKRWKDRADSNADEIAAAKVDAALRAENERMKREQDAMAAELVSLRAQIELVAKMGGAMPGAGTALTGRGQAVQLIEGEDTLPDITGDDGFMGGGGIVDAPEEMPAEDDDPLRLNGGKRSK